MPELRVTCIKRDERQGTDYEVITAVGGPGGWKKTVPEVIAAIAAGNSFYVQVGANKVSVSAYPASNPRYIRTTPDSTRRDNLLSLPDCP
ncbi:DUF3892 domain-containing protein [Corallococcus sp. Z5C101001]|nr:DUF3892 domain-containing protein [Corallococcus sp. Z5C101001]